MDKIIKISIIIFVISLAMVWLLFTVDTIMRTLVATNILDNGFCGINQDNGFGVINQMGSTWQMIFRLILSWLAIILVPTTAISGWIFSKRI
jgi:hypothetical protein